MSWMNKVVALDTETTGFGEDARIIELAFVTFDSGVVVDRWSSLLWADGVDWNSSQVLGALKVNEITVEELRGKPTFMDVFHKVYEYLRFSDIWLAHNAKFDLRMLRQEFQRARSIDIPIKPAMVVDTMSLSRRFHPEEGSHKLGDVAARWNVAQEDAHRATVDAEVCGKIFREMVKTGKLPEDFGEFAADWNRDKDVYRRRY